MSTKEQLKKEINEYIKIKDDLNNQIKEKDIEIEKLKYEIQDLQFENLSLINKSNEQKKINQAVLQLTALDLAQFLGIGAVGVVLRIVGSVDSEVLHLKLNQLHRLGAGFNGVLTEHVADAALAVAPAGLFHPVRVVVLGLTLCVIQFVVGGHIKRHGL